MSQDIMITKKCRNCKPFLLQISALFSVLSRHFVQSCRLDKVLYFSTVPSGFLSPLVLFSTNCLVTITIWPQPIHFSLKSAPTRRISHSWLPHGCGFFSFTISPTSYTILIFPLFKAGHRNYVPRSHGPCRVLSSLLYTPTASPRISPIGPLITRSARLSIGVTDLLISTSLLPL